MCFTASLAVPCCHQPSRPAQIDAFQRVGMCKDWHELVGDRWTKDGFRLLLLGIPGLELIDLVQP